MDTHNNNENTSSHLTMEQPNNNKTVERPRFRKENFIQMFLFVFLDIVFKFGIGILCNLLLIIFDSWANLFWTQC